MLPVIRELTASGVATSIDTYRAEVAAAALEAGAGVINDVSGGLGDPRMAAVAADAGCPWILMHWRGHSADMQQLAHYDDVVGEVVTELTARIEAALAAGVAPSALIVDPGLGFAKTAEHNWALLNRLDAIMALGFPVLVGASRKSFLGRLLADPMVPPSGGRARVGDHRAERIRGAAGRLGSPRARCARERRRRPRDRGDSRRRRPSSRYGQNDDNSPPPTGRTGRNVVAAMSDHITLTGLRVRGHHGVLESERRDGQDFIIDADLELGTQGPAATD